MDIRPPRKQPPQIVVPPRTIDTEHRLPAPVAEPLLEDHAASLEMKPQKSRKKWWLIGIGGLLLVIVGLMAAGYFWYQQALAPVSDDPNAARVAIEIESGTTPGGIRDMLAEKGLIRSGLAFDIYTKLSGTQDRLQAGSYRLTPAESTPEIVGHMTSGRVESFDITFFPDATLTKIDSRDYDVTTVLEKAGYSEEEIEAALAKSYDHPLFAGKPASADLEGYVYGETYTFPAGATAEDILTRTFDEMYKVIQDNGLIAKYRAKGLNLYEGITLASIVQREVADARDQKQVAQVFYTRLKQDMPLGSDVTYHYAADKMGVPRDFNLDSPYNTRKVTGLPPGPIASPGESALLAVGDPASGDYVYFLSGDDDVTYFAHTQDEHEQNITNHCQKKCQLP